MEEATDGVILFSLGTNVNSSDLPPETITSILEGFAQLKQKVLWKFEEELKNIPDNVKIMKWLPQNDILAHRNLKVFITHGGLLSTTEAMSRGVPVVGIPLGGDQHINMRMVEEAGWGRLLELHTVDKNTLFDAVNEIINDARFKQTAERKSKILKDNPITPLDNAVWWIEYVIRHRGAAHLRSAVQDLTWYQVYQLDVYGLATTMLIAGIAIALWTVKCVSNKLASFS